MSFFESLRHGIAAIAYDPVEAALAQPHEEAPKKERSSPAVQALLEDDDYSVRMIGHLANGNKENLVTQIATVLVENHGAMRLPKIAEITGIPTEDIWKQTELFRGHLTVVAEDVVIAEPLLPILPQQGNIYELAKVV